MPATGLGWTKALYTNCIVCRTVANSAEMIFKSKKEKYRSTCWGDRTRRNKADLDKPSHKKTHLGYPRIPADTDLFGINPPTILLRLSLGSFTNRNNLTLLWVLSRWSGKINSFIFYIPDVIRKHDFRKRVDWEHVVHGIARSNTRQ